MGKPKQKIILDKRKVVISSLGLILCGLGLNLLLFSIAKINSVIYDRTEATILSFGLLIILGIGLYLVIMLNKQVFKLAYPKPLIVNVIVILGFVTLIFIIPHINFWQLNFYLNQSRYQELAQKVVAGDYNSQLEFPFSLGKQIDWSYGWIESNRLDSAYANLTDISIGVDFDTEHGQQMQAIHFQANDSIIGRHAGEDIVYDLDDQISDKCVNPTKLADHWYLCASWNF